MPKYRYFTADLLTGEVIADVEMYGVYAQKRLNGAGSFTGTVKLIGDSFRDSLSLAATQPARTAIYMERNDELIWGGILWSRTYSNQARAISMTAQSFESYFDHVVFENHFIQQKVNQEIIFQNMVNQLQTDAVNLGIIVDTPLPTTNMPRTVLIPGYEFHYASEVVSQLVDTDNGLEYTIDVNTTGTVDQPELRLRLGYPLLGAANAELAFDFPGNVVNYWLPENGANSGAKFVALGYGSGNKITRAVATDQNTIDAGYPAWWIVNQYSTIADLQLIQDKAAGDAIRLKMPLVSPTFELKPEGIAEFSSWNNLGDTFKVHIEDVRFPDGYDITSRMIGWELSPASAEGSETLKLTVEGADS